ncbi:hypothetical protein D3C76_658360 [compost metagenome]
MRQQDCAQSVQAQRQATGRSAAQLMSDSMDRQRCLGGWSVDQTGPSFEMAGRLDVPEGQHANVQRLTRREKTQ